MKCRCVLLTGEVVELMQRLHDDGDEGQVQLSDVGSDLRLAVAWVCIVAAEQGVDCTNGLFMKEENPGGENTHVCHCVSRYAFVLQAKICEQ